MDSSHDEFFREHWDVNERIGHFGSPSNCVRKKPVENMMSGKAITRTIRGYFLTSSVLFTKRLSPVFPASFDQGNTQPGNDIYVNNIRDVSIQNGNINLDYSKEENDENTIINTDDQLSESEILCELYKIFKKETPKKQRNIF